MVADISEAEPCGHPEHASAGCEHRGFADTESPPRAHHRTRLEARGQAKIDIGIVTNGIANGLIESQHGIRLILRRRCRRARERDDRRRVAVDEDAWAEKAVLGHRGIVTQKRVAVLNRSRGLMIYRVVGTAPGWPACGCWLSSRLRA